jgi:hypothetical protein
MICAAASASTSFELSSISDARASRNSFSTRNLGEAVAAVQLDGVARDIDRCWVQYTSTIEEGGRRKRARCTSAPPAKSARF